ncbi:phosphoribosylformimino-5-aminoimidazole carboxamide ribotide isomerase [Legionella quinlivanii]|uniref:1-(5-phosphoribosyl)-5-[(5-phosphoribosylamino)methylideneamino] imidazole-4-carboxamide isomerase n=1 Tax=Legionella quinlivanii TaxID=45073 RepID=A0A0W0Y3W6_9GAMM|nr:1-(5-phosphoribosyl)-5-[(5-phosphoribosylamino)methylideneamino] imidazole-4-carboxamide isomerase [Legionella quinlivanii]KTD51709.1 phosphoribosylformimino-5-aminoimidazole carboxamide ribotide isomerase [Legionella quinlivanii]SEF63766.1 1-(5-phosphoribosyl)-5-[(5-phosphoribosylamino)methylideneamino] imidazole-4-carboxamide isomerase [Legionella quinlivanii DSM 21216]STY10764.1 phosphoribosylformimino-5-aminoimidazole carboxamide ribotide isomerase [Legionella quinlivanii]
MNIIPAIDLQQGQCVRLRQGEFLQTTIYPQTALQLATLYRQKGMTRLHLVDLDGARSGCMEQLELITSLLSSGLILQAGGGIRSLETVKQCLDAGIHKIVLGSLAVHNPDLTRSIIRLAGGGRIVLALDIRWNNNLPLLTSHGWQEPTAISLWDLVEAYSDTDISEILCTNVQCDGMMQGPDFSLYQLAIDRFPHIQWQASGGIRGTDDLKRLADLGLSAAILGRMLYETDFDLSSYTEGVFLC